MMAGVVYEQELEIIYLKPYHSWNPSSLIKGGDRTFQKLGHWGGGGWGTKFFARSGG